MRSYANRGKPFEMLINHSNQAYKFKKWAYIEKAEPNVKVHHWLSKNMFAGWFESDGFVDYFGICQGRALAFEAKTTKKPKSFPLSSVTENQVSILKSWKEAGAISFFLVEFEKYKEIYLVDIDGFYEWWEAAKTGGRKSIPYEWFVTHCDQVKTGRGIALDYLGVLNLL